MYILISLSLDRHSHLQRLLNAGLHHSLHNASSLMHNLWLGRQLIESIIIPPTIPNLTEGSLAELKDFPDMGVEINLSRSHNHASHILAVLELLYLDCHHHIHCPNSLLTTEHKHRSHPHEQNSLYQSGPNINYLFCVDLVTEGYYRCIRDWWGLFKKCCHYCVVVVGTIAVAQGSQDEDWSHRELENYEED